MIPRSSGSRILVVGGVVGAVLIALVSWILVISPLRDSAQALRADTAAVETGNLALEAKENFLRREARHRPRLIVDARAALAALPPGPHLPGFNRQLARQAEAEGLSLVSISVGASAAPASAAETKALATATLSIPVTVQSSGSFAAQLRFLHAVQQVGPRRALVTSTSLAPGENGEEIGRSSIMTIQITLFSAPLTEAVRHRLASLLLLGPER